MPAIRFIRAAIDAGPPETTSLQVVKNTGWMIPYVGCMIVAVGMLAHFSLTLVRFLRRRDAEELADERAWRRETVPGTAKPRRKGTAGPARTGSRWTGVAIPAAVVVVLAGWLAESGRCAGPGGRGLSLLRVRQAAAGLRRAYQAVRHAGPQCAADSFWPADVPGRGWQVATGHPLAAGRDHPQQSGRSSTGC